MIKEWLVERRGYDHWRAPANRISHDGQARLSAMLQASLLRGLKLHGANSTMPHGGLGRMTASK